MNYKYPNNKLTVIIRDDSPMCYAHDSPAYRSVTIELTPEQIKKLALKEVWRSGLSSQHEKISQCFIEPEVEGK